MGELVEALKLAMDKRVALSLLGACSKCVKMQWSGHATREACTVTAVIYRHKDTTKKTC